MQFHRVLFSILVLLAAVGPASGQSGNGAAWAMRATSALTSGHPVSGFSESGSVTRTVGPDQEQGTIVLQSSGIMNSEVDISTDSGVRSEVRTLTGRYPDGAWIGPDGTRHPMKLHNCWTDAVWFFPALSLLADYTDPNLVFEDLGQEQYGGSSVEHVRVYRTIQGLSQQKAKLVAHLSTVHYYLDSRPAIPMALAFATHADHDLGIDIPIGVVFSDYRSVNGVLVPFQVAESFNGSLTLQITITSASINAPGPGH